MKPTSQSPPTRRPEADFMCSAPRLLSVFRAGSIPSWPLLALPHSWDGSQAPRRVTTQDPYRFGLVMPLDTKHWFAPDRSSAVFCLFA